MGTFSIWHWVVVLLVLGVPAWLGVKIARRAGFTPAAGLLFLIPIAGLITIWVWAFRDWPGLNQAASRSSSGMNG